MRTVRFQLWVFLTMAGVVVAVEAIEFAARRWVPGLEEWSLGVGRVYIAFYAVYYGLYRAIRFQPMLIDDYRRWLTGTPWTFSRPLPIGPVRLVWQDLAVLVVMSLFYRWSHEEPGIASLPNPWFEAIFIPLLLVLTSFLLVQTALIIRKGPEWAQFTLLMGWGGVAWLLPDLSHALLGLGLVYFVAMAGVDSCLKRLPFELSVKTTSPPDTGWHFDGLSGKRMPWWPTFRQAVLLSLLIGWWYFVILRIALPHWQDQNPEDDVSDMATKFVFLGGFLALLAVRFYVYLRDHKSPLGLWSRLILGRPIIPGFDQVFIAPLCALALMGIAWKLVFQLGFSVPITLGVSMGAISMVCFAMGPSLRRWTLIGDHCVRETSIKALLFEFTAKPVRRKRVTHGPIIGGLSGLEYVNRWMLSQVTAILGLLVVIFLLVSWTSDGRRMGGFSVLFVFAMTLGVAISRVWEFHPLWRRGYVEWLKSLPWTRGKPLPLGPVSLVWQDLLILATLVAACVFCWAFYFPPEINFRIGTLIAIQLLVYLLGYSLMGLRLLYLTGQTGVLLFQLFAVGMAFYFLPARIPFVAVVVAVFLVACWGIRRSLRFFPWENTWQYKLYEAGLVLSSSQRMFSPLTIEPFNESHLGWNYARLSAKVEPDMMRQVVRFFSALVAGWWVFVLADKIVRLEAVQQTDLTPDRIVALELMLYVIPAVAAVTVRLVIYLKGTAPPITLFGRLLTGRFVIPKYDRVFLVPLAALIVAWVFPGIGRSLGISHDVLVPICTTTVLLILLLGGPSLKRWRLTGGYAVSRKRPARDELFKKTRQQREATPAS